MAKKTPLLYRISSININTRKLDMSVFLSEVAGEGRWTQFNVPLPYVRDFFRVDPPQNTQLELASQNIDGTPGQPEQVAAIYKPNSVNWAFEIPGAAGLDFDPNHRPIIALSDDLYPTFIYDLIMPSEARYNSIREFLHANRQTQQAHLARLHGAGNIAIELRQLGVNI